MTPPLIPAFGYLRVSGQGQVDGDGFPRQRAAIEAYAQAHGFEVVQWFQEEAVSGKTEWDTRPAWLEMVSQVNGTSVILIEALHRLARDLMVQEHIIDDLRRREIALISAAEPDLCIDDPSRKLLRQIMGAIAEYDRAMIAAKLSGARQRMREATGRCEGRKPFGARPSEAQALEFMNARRAEGYSFDVIARKLNEARIPTRYGKPWIGATVCRILKTVTPQD